MESKSYNPTGITNIGDPFVLKAEGKYYVYATSFCTADGKEGFNVWESDDLKNFSAPIKCYSIGERSFGYRDFWAPEVVAYNGKYVMHYSARDKKTNSLRIGVAISDSPVGEFVDVNDKKPMFDLGYACIDGHVFMDDDGKKYFYFSRDCSENVYNGFNESHIYVATLSDDLFSIRDEKMLIRPSLPYERAEQGNYAWNEGPFVIKRNKLYYLFYSANFFASKNYCTCVAVSSVPDGNFVKYDAPVIQSVENKISGPGHNCVVNIDGIDYVVYHVHTDYNLPDHNRQMFIDALKFDGDKILKIVPTLKES